MIYKLQIILLIFMPTTTAWYTWDIWFLYTCPNTSTAPYKLNWQYLQKEIDLLPYLWDKYCFQILHFMTLIRTSFSFQKGSPLSTWSLDHSFSTMWSLRTTPHSNNLDFIVSHSKKMCELLSLSPHHIHFSKSPKPSLGIFIFL